MQARENSGMYNMDAHTASLLNVMQPGADGSVLGADIDPELSDTPSTVSGALATYARDGRLWTAAIGGGMIALGVAYLSARMRTRRSRSLYGLLMRKRPWRWSFAR